eukprot:CAMPEP_0202379350 /NCGR_PEP_ID=MMETSP1127-20130417/23776_1 /ASSEMBLY_ACC=CAM_ASM_000462 /TAXON_ID=3047 /ORGANISM="Dunaliella tertiolecta, Strain CCMP1320" /LENGTH=48 /DNA_ID= /DNA_START= /DNA_END= /DNA_ORIENTATION=
MGLHSCAWLGAHEIMQLAPGTQLALAPQAAKPLYAWLHAGNSSLKAEA